VHCAVFELEEQPASSATAIAITTLCLFTYEPYPCLMTSVRLDVISIGTLSRNRLWGETEPVRTAHSTTTLIRSGKRTILVDPGLPAQILAARLYERTGLRPEQVDTVFRTNFRPAPRAGLPLFPDAKLLIHEAEQEAN